MSYKLHKGKAKNRVNQSFLKRLAVSVLAVFLFILGMPLLFKPAHSTLAQVPTSSAPKVDNVVLDWNTTATTIVQQIPGISSPHQFRALAITHAAIFDAVNAVDRRYTTYAVDLQAPEGTSAEAAAASAGYTVLVKLFPDKKAALDNALKASLDKIPDGRAENDGVNLGKEVAEKIVSLRANDGANAKVDYKPGKGVGIWQPTPPAFAPAVLTQLGQVKPFAIQSADQFTINEPLAINSPEYIRELNEVKSIGGRNSKLRTADQTAAALFWTASTPIVWNSVARSAAIANKNSITDNARLFALLNIAGTDSYIAGYKIKYKHNVWRPVTAIRNAEVLGNSALTADPDWEPLIITPAHPDYISGHCVSSDSPKKILQLFFGSDAVKTSFTFPANVGTTRYYTSFSQIAKEVGEARIWSGVHTRSADLRGGELGDKVADYVFQNILRPIS